MPLVMQDSGIAMLLLVFMLGLRHGFDPDHLATIDGMTRVYSSRYSGLAKWIGLLFSFGHGMLLILVAGVIGVLADTWKVPGWFESLGAWISICFLLALGIVNLYAVFQTRSDEVVKMRGIKSRLFVSLFASIQHPGWIVLTGALFALSFDAMSQVVFFSISAQARHDWLTPMLLGLVFMLGMIVTDGLNGYWVARMIQRTDKLTLIASRVLGLTVAGLSLAVGAMGLSRQLSPDFGILMSISPLQQGVSIIAFVIINFVLALWLSRCRNALSA